MTATALTITLSHRTTAPVTMPEATVPVATDQRTPDPLVAACIANDRRSMEVFYKKYFSALFPVAERYARDELEAKEILNTAFLKIFRALPQHDQTRSLPAWLRTIVVNTGLDAIRNRNKGCGPTAELDHAADVHFSEMPDGLLYRDDLLASLRQLPEMQRTVLLLFAVDGYSHQEIGAQLGITENNSRWHLHDARQRMKKILS